MLSEPILKSCPDTDSDAASTPWTIAVAIPVTTTAAGTAMIADRRHRVTPLTDSAATCIDQTLHETRPREGVRRRCAVWAPRGQRVRQRVAASIDCSADRIRCRPTSLWIDGTGF